jgi:hypothetical protein
MRYMVFIAQDAPAAGEFSSAKLYFGEHATVLEAVEAGATAMNVRDGVQMWVLEAPATINRYVVSCERSFSPV